MPPVIASRPAVGRQPIASDRRSPPTATKETTTLALAVTESVSLAALATASREGAAEAPLAGL